MHEPYENDEDNRENDDYYDYFKDPYQWSYKFDIGPDAPISNWLIDIVNQWYGGWSMFNIPEFPVQKFPVNSWNPSTDKGNSFQYLGSNYQGSQVWKKKYFVSDKFHHNYINHLKTHAIHFLQQPSYYNGMFDILN